MNLTEYTNTQFNEIYNRIQFQVKKQTGMNIESMWVIGGKTAFRVFHRDGRPETFMLGVTPMNLTQEMIEEVIKFAKRISEEPMPPSVICIDFDGTCVGHEFPNIGKDIGAVPVLKALVQNGHKLVLFTMRSDVVNPESEDNNLHLKSGEYLTEAVNWFKSHDIPLYGIQSNPTQHTWTTSPKAYGKLYIDDAALGCPLKRNPYVSDRPFVDWEKVQEELISQGYINHKLKAGDRDI